MTRPAARRGVTLVELIAVIAILAILAAVVGLSARGAPPVRASDGLAASLSAARAQALRSGHPVPILIDGAGKRRAITAMPDGSAVADSGLPVDRLSGRPTATPSP